MSLSPPAPHPPLSACDHSEAGIQWPQSARSSMGQGHGDTSLGELRVQRQPQPLTEATLALGCPPAAQPSGPSSEATTVLSVPPKPRSPVSTHPGSCLQAGGPALSPTPLGRPQTLPAAPAALGLAAHRPRRSGSLPRGLPRDAPTRSWPISLSWEGGLQPHPTTSPTAEVRPSPYLCWHRGPLLLLPSIHYPRTPGPSLLGLALPPLTGHASLTCGRTRLSLPKSGSEASRGRQRVPPNECTPARWLSGGGRR